MRNVAAILGLSLMTAVSSRGEERSVTIARLTVTVWSSDTSAPATARPVIVFSHGFHGCSTQSRFLMQAFAAAGYLILAPNHRDATCGEDRARWMSRPTLPFRRPESWSDATYRDRADDIRRLLEAIRLDDRFRTQGDWSRVALAGHSLGGYTVLGSTGAWQSWKIGDVKAVLALSPYTEPFLRRDALGALAAPVMYQGGSRDYGITPALRRRQGAFDQSPSPKYYVEFRNAGHFAWTDLSRVAHDEIVTYSLAFMNRYVKDTPADPVLTRALPGVTAFRFSSERGRNPRAPDDGCIARFSALALSLSAAPPACGGMTPRPPR